MAEQGPILRTALVLALLKKGIEVYAADSRLYILALSTWEVSIQFGHVFLIAIISIKITVPIVHTRVLGALYDP